MKHSQGNSLSSLHAKNLRIYKYLEKSQCLTNIDPYTITINEAENKILFNRSSLNIAKFKQDGGCRPTEISTLSDDDDWKRAIHFFVNNLRKFESLEIDYNTNQIKLTYLYDSNNEELKKEKFKKRTKPRLELSEYLATLPFLKKGYFKEMYDNSIIYINKEDTDISGCGFSPDGTEAEYKAILEYLERMAASENLPNQEISTFKVLKERVNVLSPELLGIYEKEIAEKMGIKVYSEDLVLEWCEAKSLLSQNYRFLPTQYVQYLKKDFLNPFVVDNSNGCAIGNSFDEAATYACLEVLEREVFFNYWFDGGNLYQLREEDNNFISSRRKFFELLGYELNFFLIENQFKLPVIWGVLQSKDLKNDIYSIIGLGCHFQLEYAIEAAFSEIYNTYQSMIKRIPKSMLQKKIKGVESQTTLNNIEDHILYFASYNAKPLLESKIRKVWEIGIEEYLIEPSIYVVEELMHIIKRLKKTERDILIVDQTNNYLQGLGLYCVKAILPDGVPIDFSSNYLRKKNLPVCTKIREQKNIHPLG